MFSLDRAIREILHVCEYNDDKLKFLNEGLDVLRKNISTVIDIDQSYNKIHVWKCDLIKLCDNKDDKERCKNCPLRDTFASKIHLSSTKVAAIRHDILEVLSAGIKRIEFVKRREIERKEERKEEEEYYRIRNIEVNRIKNITESKLLGKLIRMRVRKDNSVVLAAEVMENGIKLEKSKRDVQYIDMAELKEEGYYKTCEACKNYGKCMDCDEDEFIRNKEVRVLYAKYIGESIFVSKEWTVVQGNVYQISYINKWSGDVKLRTVGWKDELFAGLSIDNIEIITEWTDDLCVNNVATDKAFEGEKHREYLVEYRAEQRKKEKEEKDDKEYDEFVRSTYREDDRRRYCNYQAIPELGGDYKVRENYLGEKEAYIPGEGWRRISIMEGKEFASMYELDEPLGYRYVSPSSTYDAAHINALKMPAAYHFARKTGDHVK